jgi:hypothetical protein
MRIPIVITINTGINPKKITADLVLPRISIFSSSKMYPYKIKNANITKNQPRKLKKGIEKIENVSLGSESHTHKPLEFGYIEAEPKLTITGSIQRSRETARNPAMQA